MAITLEQIDTIRERTGVSYELAKDALDKSNGDVLDALIYLEKENAINSAKKCSCNCECSSFKNKARELIKKGNENKFIIKKADSILINVPLNAAVVATLFAAPAAIIGVTAALATKHSIKVEKPEEKKEETIKED